MFESSSIGIPCPACGHETQKTIGWIKANNTMACDGCGASIDIKADNLLAGLKQAENAVADFRRNIRKFSKR